MSSLAAFRRAPRPVGDASSSTQTQTDTGAPSRDASHIGVLRLRGEPRRQPGVRWAEDVVDNSNMNKKKSKVCCIYHKPRAIGESSSESSSSSSSSGNDSDSEPDNSTARMSSGSSRRGAMGRKAHARRRDHDHLDCEHGGHAPDHAYESSASDDDDDDQHASLPADGNSNRTSRPSRRTIRPKSPNAYEKMPNYKKRAQPQ